MESDCYSLADFTTVRKHLLIFLAQTVWLAPNRDMSTLAECKNMTVDNEWAAHIPTNQSYEYASSDKRRLCERIWTERNNKRAIKKTLLALRIVCKSVADSVAHLPTVRVVCPWPLTCMKRKKSWVPVSQVEENLLTEYLYLLGQGSRILDSLPLKMGPKGCPETPMRNYH